jgi:hypothetical protein
VDTETGPKFGRHLYEHSFNAPFLMHKTPTRLGEKEIHNLHGSHPLKGFSGPGEVLILNKNQQVIGKMAETFY